MNKRQTKKRSDPKPEMVWVRGHFNGNGAWIPGHWRRKPRSIKVQGHFRGLTYVRGHARRRPSPDDYGQVKIAGLEELSSETLTALLRDLDPPLGF